MVNVIMSTYNGEKYIEEQIDSILNQSYRDIKLYIRDDGSTDGTLDVLKLYKNDPRVCIYLGDNVGYGPSFMHLLKIADQGDYWAFSDQDDLWEKDKLQHAVEKLSQIEMGKPAMYFHKYLLTNQDLSPICLSRDSFDDYSFQKAITECVHLGFSTVMNKSLRKKMLQNENVDIVSHDWWAEMVVMAFGVVCYDEYIGAKHRRLENSVSSEKLKKRIDWFFKSMYEEPEIRKLTRCFHQVYDKELGENDKQVLDLFVSEKYSIIKSIKKACFPKRWRSSIMSEISIRFLMLIGKI